MSEKETKELTEVLENSKFDDYFIQEGIERFLATLGMGVLADKVFNKISDEDLAVCKPETEQIEDEALRYVRQWYKASLKFRIKEEATFANCIEEIEATIGHMRSDQKDIEGLQDETRRIITKLQAA